MGFKDSKIIKPGESSLITIPGREEEEAAVEAAAAVLEEVKHFVGATSVAWVQELERAKVCRNRPQLAAIQARVLKRIQKAIDVRYKLEEPKES